ncbi:DNA-binding transcriptional regulator, AcrR family [Nocardioides exalbidus]|uniref:DNA-binding transcriptional regulator, AcrR family n=1 Tax=Nocardioides exalbidus TaxID=402596 RepID=A0A1H4MXW1_9ACTN|nr:TetR/AcrR family transcriptional regulator [Nocardioides exalbidus]SEB88020.1 DNA-binding transcriptional regulator, AcrR family [Nocardioides exalbidus]
MADRNEILGAAQGAFNADPAASMAAVAEAAGISRATLHRHFDSREALLVELGTRSLDQWAGRLDEVDAEALAASGDAPAIRAALETLVLGYVDDADGFGFALTDHVILANADLEERTQVLADREAVLFAAAQRVGVLRPDLPPRWFGHAIYGLLVSGREAVRIGDVARRDVGRLVLSSLLTGIAQPQNQDSTP